MNIRQALQEGAPSLAKHRAAADEIAKQDHTIQEMRRIVKEQIDLLNWERQQNLPVETYRRLANVISALGKALEK